MSAAELQANRGPLSGIRVVEIASVVLGPLACQLLGDLGAEVIKIEPLFGDSNRRVGPSGTASDLGAFFVSCNRNKRSLALDLKHPEGHAAALAVIRGADVLVHNFRPAAMRRLGLDYASVCATNPAIIYCATYGFGESGPYAGRGAFDDTIQAAVGLAALQQAVSGQMRYVPTIVADKTAANMVAQAVLAALFHRERSGQGQEIEVPMFETMTAWVMVEHLWGRSFEPAAEGTGYPRVLSQQRVPYRTLDARYLCLMPYWDAHWSTFCDLCGHPELKTDQRFSTIEARLANIDACFEQIGSIVAEHGLDHWLALFGDSSVPVMEAKSLDDLLTDAHLQEVGFWQEFDHPSAGRMRLTAPPVNFSKTPAGIHRLPPGLGEHSEEILREAGLSGEQIRQLCEQGVIHTGISK